MFDGRRRCPVSSIGGGPPGVEKFPAEKFPAEREKLRQEKLRRGARREAGRRRVEVVAAAGS